MPTGFLPIEDQGYLIVAVQLPDGAALVGFDLHFHTLAKATLTGLYGR